MEKVIKVGIIGCGGIANLKHLPCIVDEKNVEIVAFCDIILERAVATRAKFGKPDAFVCTDYKEVLAMDEIDVVHVLTPNKAHAEISIAALHAGKQVMCEKPMAKSAADAQRMVDAARETGNTLTIGYQHRHKAESIYAKKFIEDGGLGEIYYAKCLAVRRRGTPNWGVFLNKEEQGGGPVIDIATHSLDLCLYLMDNYEPEMVVGKTHKKIEHPEAGNSWGDDGVSTSELEEAACGFIRMKNGATIILETSWALNTINTVEEGSCELCGTKGGLQIINNRLTINSVRYDKLSTEEVDTGNRGVAFYAGKNYTPPQRECMRWYDCVRNGTTPIVTPEQALVVSQILEAIYVSSETGKPVFFE